MNLETGTHLLFLFSLLISFLIGLEFQVCLANEEESRDKRLSPLPIKSFLFVIGGLKPT
jgi:hypothetical protein